MKKMLCKILVAGLMLSCSVQAKDKASAGSLKSGEAGYKAGCSVAAQVGTQACGELWSEKQKKEQEKRRRQKEEERRKKAESEKADSGD